MLQHSERDFGSEGDFIQRKRRSSRLENHFKNEPPNEINAAALNGSSWNRCWAAQKITGAFFVTLTQNFSKTDSWGRVNVSSSGLWLLSLSPWQHQIELPAHWPVQPANTDLPSHGFMVQYCTFLLYSGDWKLLPVAARLKRWCRSWCCL